MDFHILIRETLDWNHTTYDDLKDDFVRQVVRQWDSALYVSFMECRARLKAIVLDSFKMLPSVQIHDYRCFDVKIVKADDVLLICDDDDWYHPGIVEHLRDYLNAHTWLKFHLILWPDGVFLSSPLSRQRRPNWKGRIRIRALGRGGYVVRTNNYAISGRFLCKEPERLDAVLRHAHADRYLKKASPPVIELKTPLSLVNKHPCTQMAWHNNLRSIDVAEWGDVLRKLSQRYIERPAFQPSFPWAHGYISRSKAVFEEALGV